jgi:hypothetical protein
MISTETGILAAFEQPALVHRRDAKGIQPTGMPARADVFAFHGDWSKIGRRHRVIAADAAPDLAQ